MLRDAEPHEMGKAKSDTPGTVLTPCEACRGWAGVQRVGGLGQDMSVQEVTRSPGPYEPSVSAAAPPISNGRLSRLSPALPAANPALLEPEADHFYAHEPPRSTQLLVQW